MIWSKEIDRKPLIYPCLAGVNGQALAYPWISERSASNDYFQRHVSFVNHRLWWSRFLIQPKPAPPRRDVHLHHVIINEKADQQISKHRVSDRSASQKRASRLSDVGRWTAISFCECRTIRIDYSTTTRSGMEPRDCLSPFESTESTHPYWCTYRTAGQARRLP